MASYTYCQHETPQPEVLAAERTRDCLLYGPTETGKNLPEEIIPKESGLSVLKVIATGINHEDVSVIEKLIHTLF